MPALDSLPRKIGPYRTIKKIGEGGMGVVYLGSDRDGNQVAIKVLGPAVAADPNARNRLAREVETMRRVKNRFVAEIVDADVDCPSPYIVTRYVPGRTLEEAIRQEGPLKGTALESVAEGLAEALTAIHAAGVVHRDLKPGNVMLDRGMPVVIDFGIAHIPDSTRLTKTGLVMGTPGYLAPEVIEGQSSSGASDVHSWGATVAYAATGRQPFGTGSYQTIFFRVLEGEAELDGIPPRLLPFVTDALSTDPKARPSARWLAGQLGSPFNGATRVDSPAVPRTRIERQLPAPTRVMPPPGEPAQPAKPAWSGWAARQAQQAQQAQQPQQAPHARPEYPSRTQAAREFADLLPPVPPAPVQQRRQAQAAPRSAAPREPEWHPPGLGLLTLAAGVGAVALAVLLPVAGTAIALALITLLRAVDRAQAGLADRRTHHGVTPGDIVVVIATAPLTVVRSAFTTIFWAPLALVPALIAGVASIAFARADTLPEAGSWAAGAAIAFYCVGPGSAGPRHQLRKMSAAMIHSRLALTVAFISSWALARAIVTSALSQPPLIWPATSSTVPHLLPGLPSLGGALHSLQKWLLGNTVGMLHLP